MKLSLLLPAMILASAAHATAPAIQVLGRAETTPLIYGESKLIKDKNGQALLVGISETSNKQVLNIDAVNSAGMHVYSDGIFAPGPGKRLSLRDVSFNDSGELVAIVVNEDQNGLGGSITSENLSTGARAAITEIGESPQFLGRVRANGKDLVAATISLGHGPGGTYPELVKVVEESSGNVVQQVMVNQSVIYGHVGVDSKGKAKVVLVGNFLKLLDVESGTLTDLAAAAPDAYTGEIRTVLGKLITLTDKKTKTTQLLRPSDLVEGLVKPVASFPEKTAFTGGDLASLAVISSGNQIQIVDLATNKPLGGKIGKAETTSGALGVEQLLINSKGVPAVVVVSEVLNPMTFRLGTLLRYIELSSGTVLRTAINRNIQMQGEVRELPNGNLVAVERTLYSDDHVTVTNLTTGKTERDGQDALIGRSIVTQSGQLVALHAGANDQVCAETLTGPQEETCSSDPLVNAAVRYGYGPFETSTDLVRLPLLKISGTTFEELGFIDLKIN